MMYWPLAVITEIYVVASAIQDIKERKIYYVPALVLTAFWSLFLLTKGGWSLRDFFTVFGIHMLCYLFFHITSIWGGGDSDMFLLFAGVLLLFLEGLPLSAVLFMECIVFVITFSFSLLIGWMEHRWKKIPFQINGDIAVVPGFAVSMTGMLLLGGYMTW